MLSERIKKIPESGIRKIFTLATENQGEYINLSIGQPHFKVPTELKEAAKRAIDADFNTYTPTIGILKLREKIAEKLNNKNNIKAHPDEIIITAGVSGSIFLSLNAILNPGDEVILADPYFVLYKEIIEFLGAKPVFLDTYPDFQIDAKKLEQIITPKTKTIIINSPNNPTGAVYGKDELKKIAEVARKHDLLIISDEIYECFDYDNKFFSIGSIYEKTITLNGFTKSHAVAGWRVGYAHGPQEIIDAMNKLQQYTFVCPPSFAQVALAEKMEVDLNSEYENYKAKSNLVYEGLKDKYELNKSQGAFYAFIKIPEGRDDFVNELIANKVLAVPGEVFSQRNDYFRISFATDDESLKKGIEILRGLV